MRIFSTLKHQTIHVEWDKALLPHIFLSRMVEQDVNLSEEFCWLLDKIRNLEEFIHGREFVVALLNFPKDFENNCSNTKHSYSDCMLQYAQWGMSCLSLPKILQVLQVYRPENGYLFLPSFGDIVITYTGERGKHIEIVSARNYVAECIYQKKFFAQVPY